MDKKGIAPLIATFLLLFFAVVIGLVVINWGRAQLEEQASCSVDPGLKFIQIEGKPQVCYGDGFTFFLVENGPAVDVESLQVRLIDENRRIFAQSMPASSILRNGALEKRITYDANQYGGVKQIKISPTIKLYDQLVDCPDRSIIFDNPKRCEEVLS
ncbi:MAG: hypothetical protein QW331_00685 [Candidatus Woesearchaeota archaeon]